MKLGIIGGAGPLASALFYETIVKECYQQGFAIPEIILINFPFTRGLTEEEGKLNDVVLQNELRYCMTVLQTHGVEAVFLACNTLHRFLPIFSASIPFLSLPRLVMHVAVKNGHKRLLILGTQSTRKFKIYHNAEISAVYPCFEDQCILEGVIDRVLEGRMSQMDSDYISELVARSAKDATFDGVVLGCTDLPVLHHHFPIKSEFTLYDSIKIPAKHYRSFQ